MTSRKVTNVAIIRQVGAYGEGLTKVFQENFKSTPEVVAFSTDNDLIGAVTNVGATKAAEVLFISSDQEDVIAFLDAVGTNASYDSKALFLTDSAASKDVVDQSPKDVLEKIRGTRPKPPAPDDLVYNSFKSSYALEYAGEDASLFSYAAHTYDAAWLVFYGIAWAKLQTDAITGAHIASGLRKISLGPNVAVQPLSWDGVVEKFRSGTGVNVQGASGKLDYDPATEETSGPIEVWHIVPSDTDPTSHVIEPVPPPP
jgi:branched-chain amino acid transport system substrate-binding protein